MLSDLLQRLLQLLKQSISTSVLIHVLICLSYLSKERFSGALDEILFVEKISEFVEWYTAHFTGQDQTAEANGVSERKTVLDLCAHMFHPKDTSHDISGTMEYNEMK